MMEDAWEKVSRGFLTVTLSVLLKCSYREVPLPRLVLRTALLQTAPRGLGASWSI